MKQLEYKVTFATPAFLGNAEQDAQWRTPPFKALLRQWWRVVYASAHADKVSVDAMRKEEGLLFGVASDQRGGSRKSRLRIRLDRWDPGLQREWPSLAKVGHPEVKFPVDSGLYLGFGPVLLPRGSKKPALKANAAIQFGESATLALACPQDAVCNLQTALALIDRYGTIGGRSRNGWGSLGLTEAQAHDRTLDEVPVNALARPWRDALDRDWPHAIGTDEHGPLIWRTRHAFDDWKGLMQLFAELKIGLRTQFRFNSGNQTLSPEPRHWLSYPVTRHSVKFWKNARLPNSLRFKVRADADGRLRGVIVHLPCLPPADPFRPDRRAIEAVWGQVHAFLDQADALARTPA